MSVTEIEYAGHGLAAKQLPNGSYQVEVTPLTGGKSFLTEEWNNLEAAMTAARRILDSGFRP
jgi:hypothetical protein